MSSFSSSTPPNTATESTHTPPSTDEPPSRPPPPAAASLFSPDLVRSWLSAPPLCAALQWVHSAVYAELQPYIYWTVGIVTILFLLLLLILGMQCYLTYQLTVFITQEVLKKKLSGSTADLLVER